MFDKKSKAYAIFNFKCPRCHEGDLFEGPLGFTNALKMPKRCDQCGQRYEPEPGYYYGAMFLSYIILGWFCLAFVGLCILVFDLSVAVSFGLLIAVVAIGFLWNLRFARALYINLMVKYEPEKKHVEPGS